MDSREIEIGLLFKLYLIFPGTLVESYLFLINNYLRMHVRFLQRMKYFFL